MFTWFSKENFVRTTGNYSYFIDVAITGDAPLQTSTISINAFTKPDRKIAIATQCKWYRKYADREYLFHTIHSNTYQLSAEDLSATIKIEVTSLEDDQFGTAIVEYGPIRLDPTTRMTLEGILSTGGSKFPINVCDEEKGKIFKDAGSLSLTSDYVRISSVFPDGKERELKFKYSYDQPKIELQFQDATRMTITFRGKESEYNDACDFAGVPRGLHPKIGVKFSSRASRDLVLLALKCFSTRSYLIDSKAISEVTLNEGSIFKEKGKDKQAVGDMLLEIESIRRELYYVMQKNSALLADKENLQNNVTRLEEELTSTIETYSTLLSDNRKNSTETPLEDDGAVTQKMKKRIEQLEHEKKVLMEELKKNKDVSDFKNLLNSFDSQKENRGGPKGGNYNPKGPDIDFSLRYELEMDQLKSENKELLAKNQELENEIRNMASRVTDLQGRRTRGLDDDSFILLENKVNDTKRLNEVLINEINTHKSKAESMEKENEILRNELTKLRESDSKIAQKKEQLLQEKIQSLEKRLQETQERRSVVRDSNQGQSEQFTLKIRELEKELAGLRDDKAKLTFEAQSLKQEIQKVNQEKTELEVKLAAVKSETSKNAVSPINKSYSNYLNTSYTTTQDPKLQELRQENSKLVRELSETKTKISSAEFNLKLKDQEIERLKALQEKLNKLSDDYRQLEAKHSKLNTEYDILKTSSESLKSTQAKSYSGYTSYRDTEQLKKENASLKEKLEAAEKELARKGQGDDNLEDQKAQLADLKKENELLQLEITTLKGKNESWLKEVDYLRNELKNLREKAGSPSKQQESKKQYEELSAKYEDLKLENQQQQRMINALREQTNKGGMGSARKETSQGGAGGDGQNIEEYKQLQRDYDALVKEKEAITKKYEDVAAKLESLKLDYEKLRREINSSGDQKPVSNPSIELSALRDEVATLRDENESLVMQRNQLSKKVEGLQKELKDSAKNPANNLQAILENLKKTNERLVNENAKLMDQIQSLTEELENNRNMSGLDIEHENQILRARVEKLEMDVSFVTQEKDRLIVELSKSGKRGGLFGL